MCILRDPVELSYAIGDVHGHAHLLAPLIDCIEAHAKGASHRVITVGDYINKGPDSAGVLRLLMKASAVKPDRFICLMGNHDLALAQAAREASAEPKFLSMGGDQLLKQSGVAHARELAPELVSWIARRPTWVSDGLRYFVHAGLDPSLPLEAQTDAIRLSMRGRFLDHDHDFGMHVVHGHTPQMSGLPTFRRFRTNIDTGVYQTRTLTAIAFRGSEVRPFVLFQSTPTGVTIRELTRTDTDA